MFRKGMQYKSATQRCLIELIKPGAKNIQYTTPNVQYSMQTQGILPLKLFKISKQFKAIELY